MNHLVERKSSGPRAGQKDKRETSNKRYYEDIKKEHYSNDFFSFKDDLVHIGHSTYKHTQRLLINLNHPALASAAADDGIATILTDIYEQGHISGHMKDIGATELASAINYCEGLWGILGQLRNEYAAVTLLDGPTFDDAVTTTGATHRFWKPESFNTFLETLEARNLVVPDFLIYLLDLLTGVRIKLLDSYEIYGLEIPATYMVMGCRLQTVTDMETERNTMVSNKGEAIQFFNKFGVGYKSYTREMSTKVRELTHPSPESTFWFDTLRLTMYGKTKALHWLGCDYCDFSGGTSWIAWKVWLYKKQIPDELKFTQVLSAHDATNNQYGGLFTSLTVNASEGDMLMLMYGIDDLVPTIADPYNATGDKWIPFLWFSYGTDDRPAAGEYEMAMVGTELTANLIVQNDAETAMTPRLSTLEYWRTTKTVSKTALDAFLLKKMISVANMK